MKWSISNLFKEMKNEMKRYTKTKDAVVYLGEKELEGIKVNNGRIYYKMKTALKDQRKAVGELLKELKERDGYLKVVLEDSHFNMLFIRAYERDDVLEELEERGYIKSEYEFFIWEQEEGYLVILIEKSKVDEYIEVFQGKEVTQIVPKVYLYLKNLNERMWSGKIFFKENGWLFHFKDGKVVDLKKELEEEVDIVYNRKYILEKGFEVMKYSIEGVPRSGNYLLEFLMEER